MWVSCDAMCCTLSLMVQRVCTLVFSSLLNSPYQQFNMQNTIHYREAGDEVLVTGGIIQEQLLLLLLSTA